MTNHVVISFHWHYLDAAASLYERSYPVPQYGDLTAHDISREVIGGHVMRDSFIGVLAVDVDQQVIGLAWGFAFPHDNPRLKQLAVKRLGAEWTENTFVIEAFAVHPDHVESDLAEQLYDGLLSRVQENHYDRMRVRLEVARMDNILAVLAVQGWDQLQRLPHVVWMGKQIQ